jgi:trimethylamine:corrinoid methyltransferase-like protein
LPARGNSGDAAPERQRADLGRGLPFAIKNGEMQLFVPFALEEGVLAIMRLEPHAELLHQLDGVMIAAFAFHEKAMDAEMPEGDIEESRKRFGEIAISRAGRVDDEPNFALACRGQCRLT